MTWKTALTRAITAEVAAEQAATQAEGERRRTWWDTTWALAAVPRAEWSEAQMEYVKRTNHSKSTADMRRRTGTRLSETALACGLPQPRFAMKVTDWIGKDGDEAKVKEAVKLLADAEKGEQSLREFSQALTGKPWTNAPENLTEADEDAVIKKVARERPAAIGKQAANPKVAATIVEDKDANKGVIQAQSRRTRRLVNKRREAVAAAGADTKGEVNDAVTAGPGLGAMDNTVGYGRVRRGQSEMVSAWIECIREQSLNALDKHMLVADQAALERHVAERRVYVEAIAEGIDPDVALAEHRREYEEQFQRDLDEAESGTTLDDVDDIERFANEGS
jgi:hypothetical protein